VPCRTPIALPEGLEAISALWDVGAGCYALSAPGYEGMLRPWRWAERRRLVEACSVDGRLDRERFVSLLNALLFEPSPPVELEPALACAALWLFGVDGEFGLLGVDEAELLFAESFGWAPGTYAEHAAVDLDRLVARLCGASRPSASEAVSSEAEGAAWNRIVVAPDG
jgi:hypothetical protein